MDKNEQIIMATPTSELFKDGYFQGFSRASDYNYEKIILENSEWVKRGIAEEDTSRKQPIAYCLVANPLSREVFYYTRAGSEERLSGKLSVGFGGHIERVDEQGGNPIQNSLLREVLVEELEIPGRVDLSVLGYINDDSNEVGKVHFGILYLATVDTRNVELNMDEASSGSLVHIDELDRMIGSGDYNVENWTRIACPPSVSILDDSRRGLIRKILKVNHKSTIRDPDLLEQDEVLRQIVGSNIDRIELRESLVESCGLSFEPRLGLEYDILFGNQNIGRYRETRVYNKGGTPFMVFGEFAQAS